MNKTIDTVVDVALGTLAVLGVLVLTFMPCKGHAQDNPEAIGPDATVTLSNVRCFDATKLDPEAEARAVLMTKTGELWLVLSDPNGLRPDALAFLTVHDGKKYVCMVAERSFRHLTVLFSRSISSPVTNGAQRK